MAILRDGCSMEAEQDDGLLFEYNETSPAKNSGEKLDRLPCLKRQRLGVDDIAQWWHMLAKPAQMGNSQYSNEL